MASTKSTVVTPVFFFASFSQSPGDDVWWRASQRSHVFADANSSTGRSGTCSATESTLRADAHGPPFARGRAHRGPFGKGVLAHALASALAHAHARPTRVHRAVPRWSMFSLRKPDPEHLSHFLARERTSPLTYAEVGATFDDELPAGYHHVRGDTVLGPGDDAWERARAAIRAWAAHRGAGMTVLPADAPITEGTTVAVLSALGPLHVLASCRIVRVVDEPHRYGFAYGTLPAHPEEGEERFVVTRGEGGTVAFEVVAFSRPHDLLTKLGGPVPRRLQARATKQYLQGMRDFVAR